MPYPGLQLNLGNFTRYFNAATFPATPVTAPFVVATVATLQALTTRPMVVITQGYTTANDGGGGPPWIWVASSTATIDNFMVVNPTGSPSGRYIRLLQAGASVSPKWAGCGLGSADDSAQFQKVIDFGAPIDLTGGTFPIVALTIGSGDAPSMVSDGSGKIIPAPSATSTSILLTISRADFTLDNVTFEMPISTNPAVAPACSRGVWFTGTPDAQYHVRNCTFIGAQYGIFVAGLTKFVHVEGNTVTGQWREGILLEQSVNSVVVNNTMRDGGYVSGGSSGAIRLGISVQTINNENIVVSGNSIANWSTLDNQEAIDLFCGGARNIAVTGNVLDGCGNGGIEIKTSGATALSPDTYQRILCGNNVIRMLTAPPNNIGVGIALNNTTPASPAGKAAKVLIVGNQISCDDLATTGIAQTGITVNGYTDVDIKDNQILNVARGIGLAGTGPTGDTSTRIAVTGNTIRAVDFGIISGTGTLAGVTIQGNNIAVTTGPALTISSGTVTDFTCTGNRFVTAGSTHAVELRDVQGGVFKDNVLVASTRGMIFQTTAPTNLRIEHNDITVSAGPAFTFSVASATIYVIDNQTNLPAANAISAGAAVATPIYAGNKRLPGGDPNTAVAGLIGDIVPNATPTLYGPSFWECTTSGNAAAAVWSAMGQLGGQQRVAPVVLGGNVALNNVANYFNGPDTGSIGAAGQVWAVWANFIVSQSGVGPDYYQCHIWNGAAIVGGEQTVTSVGININVAGGCFAIVTLAAATTFTLRAKDPTSTGGSLLADGTTIEAIRLV